jgi:hypothetical protein
VQKETLLGIFARQRKIPSNIGLFKSINRCLDGDAVGDGTILFRPRVLSPVAGCPCTAERQYGLLIAGAASVVTLLLGGLTLGHSWPYRQWQWQQGKAARRRRQLSALDELPSKTKIA